jgi:hypothetical protein
MAVGLSTLAVNDWNELPTRDQTQPGYKLEWERYQKITTDFPLAPGLSRIQVP